MRSRCYKLTCSDLQRSCPVQEIRNLDLHSAVLIHFVKFYDKAIVRLSRCKCLWPREYGIWHIVVDSLPQTIKQKLTSSKISSFSSSCFNSLRDNRCGRPVLVVAMPFACCDEHELGSCCGLILKNVGVPSMVFTIGFNKPPFSNSWADIFL